MRVDEDELSEDDILSELEDANRRKRTLERATEVKKTQYAEEIKGLGNKIKKDPAKVEIIHVPWYKKLWRKVLAGLYKFITKVG